SEIFHLRLKLGSNEFLQFWEEQLAFKGEAVQVEIPEKQTVEGILNGIDGDGNLVLFLAEGMKVIYPIGDVKLRPK
ncbi:MAG: hypothetical protein MUP19_01115, partial [Candidatus Aminicenantes bacterium]|nr:hypothetical protein [Candidatus Aminicenantes bacterium]